MTVRLMSWAVNPAYICVVLAGLMLSSCQILSSAEGLGESEVATGQENGPKISFDEIQASDPQSQIGAREHPRILAAYGGAYKDQKLEAVLALIAGGLITQSDNPDLAFDITILDSPTVNAFALPGGYLYVTRGLLALANDMSEVAAVLAHEMAHVSANHGIARSQRVKANDIADRVIDEVVTNPLAGKVAQASTQQRLVAFSQQQELQADALSIAVLGKSGYDPFAAARFLRSMDRYVVWRGGDAAAGDDMTSSHPSTPRRIEVALRHARRIGPPGTGQRNRERYLKGVDGMLFGDAETEGYVRGNRFLHRGLGITFAVPRNFALDNQTDSVLAAGPDQTALRFDAVPIEQGSKASPVDYLQSGWVNGLDPSTVKGFDRSGNPAASGYALAGDWQFAIEVVQYQGRYFRFILAAPRGTPAIVQTNTGIAQSFRPLQKSEIAGLKPLRLRVVAAKPSDSVETFARRMFGVSRKTALFRAINGLGEGDTIKTGDKVKLVTDG